MKEDIVKNVKQTVLVTIDLHFIEEENNKDSSKLVFDRGNVIHILIT